MTEKNVLFLANYRGNLTWHQAYEYCDGHRQILKNNLKIAGKDYHASMYNLRRFDHLTFLRITDEITEGQWVNKKGTIYLITWDPEAPERGDSDDRDYLAIKGGKDLVGQAFAASDTGPDVICSRDDKPWKKLWPNLRENFICLGADFTPYTVRVKR